MVTNCDPPICIHVLSIVLETRIFFNISTVLVGNLQHNELRNDLSTSIKYIYENLQFMIVIYWRQVTWKADLNGLSFYDRITAISMHYSDISHIASIIWCMVIKWFHGYTDNLIDILCHSLITCIEPCIAAFSSLAWRHVLARVMTLSYQQHFAW